MEFHRGVLERKLLQDTIALPNSSISEQRLRHWRKLFSQHQKQFPDGRLRRRNDIDRRRAVGHLMRWRVQKGVEEDGAEAKWFYIANYEKWRPGEKEDQHRAWIIAELEKRFAPYDWGESGYPSGWVGMLVDRIFRIETAQLRSKNDHQAKKAASRLLQDTLALKNRGRIPREEVAWLETVLGEKSMMDTCEDKEADDAVRGFGVNYIAVFCHLADGTNKANTKAVQACRREANVQQELETLYTHRGYSFEHIDHYVTMAKLEELLVNVPFLKACLFQELKQAFLWGSCMLIAIGQPADEAARSRF